MLIITILVMVVMMVATWVSATMLVFVVLDGAPR